MTFIDFFAGAGGFRRGMELAGHKCLGFCEYDKFAVQSYRAIHNTEGEWYAKDIREVRANDIPVADCWCAGFPCQDVSISGKQLGFKGKRSSLFFTVTGLIADLEKENRPKLLFFENVKNLLSVNRGFDFARLLVELDKIGYDAEWAVLNTADVLPQNRERVFIIGRLRGGRIGQVFPVAASGGENNVLQRFTTGTITTRTGQAATVGTYVAENKFNAQEVIYQKPRGNNVGGLHNIAPCLIRKLTPLECWRLQGWEDEDFFRAFFLDKKLAHKFNAVYQRNRNNPVRLMEWAFRHQKTSDSQLYKQAGNGVTTLVVKAIAERLEGVYADL